MKMPFLFAGFFAAILTFSACGGSEEISEAEITDTIVPETVEVIDTPYVPATPPFTPVDANYETTDLIIPEGFSYTILFEQKNDMVLRADGERFPAKGYHDMNALLPVDGQENAFWCYTSHESRYQNADLGDAGGGTLYQVVASEDGAWTVDGDFHHVDFSTVGGTLRNCGGTVAPNGNIFSAEETFAPSNRSIWYKGKGIQDTSDFNGRARYLNMGWMVEVDPNQKQAVRKHWAMGRFMHEDAEFMEDGRTVYLSDDYNPAVFFKFVADQENDYTEGQLYAFQQSEDGSGGNWLTLPRDSASMLNVRDIAMEMGATIYCRHEWLARHNGKIYINETGDDDYDWAEPIALGAQPAPYFEALRKEGTIYDDVHGRVLEFDPETDQMRVLIEGGVGEIDSTKVFSNPDCNTIVEMNGTAWLVINEDINWYTKGRVGPEAAANKQFFNEIWWLDLGIENPTVDDLHRFAVGPKGSETTGGVFTPDGMSYFVNIMHAWPRNPAPFNRSTTIVITGF